MREQYLTQRAAQAIDVELMSPTGGGFSFEQLVELGIHVFLSHLTIQRAFTLTLERRKHLTNVHACHSWIERRSGNHKGIQQGIIPSGDHLFRTRQQRPRW